MKLRASVRLLLDWLRSAGFEQLSQQFFAKLASVANLLAMPGSQLVQVRDAQPGARGFGMGMGRRVPAQFWEVLTVMCPFCNLPPAALSQDLWVGSNQERMFWFSPPCLTSCALCKLLLLRGSSFSPLPHRLPCLLTQMTWSSLRAEFPALSPAQLHRVLSQCQAVMDVGCISAWQPSEEESPATFQPGESWSACSSHIQTTQVIPFPFLGVL